MLLAVLVPLGIGLLAGLGVGSGGLLILFFTEWVGMDQLTAQGTNLAVFAFALGAALIVHLHRRTPTPAILAVIVLFGAFGAFGGAALASVIDAAALRFFLGLLLTVMGIFALFRK